MMERELVTVEFRYTTPDTGFETKIITIGIFDTFEEAIIEGNKTLEILEAHFELNTFWKRKERFSKNGDCFGLEKRLITNLAYLQTPFDFYAKIKKLKYEDVNQTILGVMEAISEKKKK